MWELRVGKLPVSGPVIPVNLELLNSVHSFQSPKALGRLTLEYNLSLTSNILPGEEPCLTPSQTGGTWLGQSDRSSSGPART